MPGSKPRQAVENFLAPIREAVTCVVPSTVYLGIRVKGYDPDNNPHPLIFNEGDPLDLGKSGIQLAIAQKYDIVRADGEQGKWRVSTKEVYILGP